MSENVFISQFLIDNSTYVLKAVFLENECDEEEIELAITDGKNLWKSKDTMESITSGAVQIERHSELIKESLKRQDNNREKFMYSLKHHADFLLFYIKFIVKPAGDFNAGKLKLRKIAQPESEILSLFSYLIQNVKQLKESNARLTGLANQRNQAMELAQQTIAEKNAMEQELYGEFLQILNEKKSKIKELDAKATKLTKERDDLKKKLADTEQALAAAKSNSRSKANQSLLRTPSPKTSPSSKHETPKIRRNAASIDADDLLDDLLEEF